LYQELLRAKLDALRAAGEYREFIPTNRIRGRYPLAEQPGVADPRPLVMWCSNDYLGMSQHPAVLAAMHRAIDEFGAGSGGSRNIGGTNGCHVELEAALADWHSKERALVFPTGFGANSTTVQTLLRLLDDPVVLSDELNHASIIDGIRSTRAEKLIFRHADVRHLADQLRRQPAGRPKIVVFESVYSVTGDIAPVEQIVEVCRRYNALVYLDEVHAVGMYGPRGAGVAAELGIEGEIDIIQGTMAKAVGVIGGYIAGSAVVVDAVRSFGSGFIFTTSLPPAVAVACNASVEHLKASEVERDRLRERTGTLRNALRRSGIPVHSTSTTHILPVVVGDVNKCEQAKRRLLEEHRIYLQAIKAPTVPRGQECFRVNATPNHTDMQMDELVAALVEVFERFDIPPLPPAGNAVADPLAVRS
jgi:5-aminolevulinate synthase